ncbi:MAG: NAD-dependent epimerase/dehydratase family protein [Verrucomicrobia bacterium]|nr:NAD-dependent epimerase/dehydratase family protein [Verrucomicrobiota bacterium]
MKVLVTGGTGFTGSHLTKRLLSRGHTVTVLDNQEGIVLDDLKQAGANVALGTVTDTGLLKDVVAGQEVIYHLAAAFRRVNLPKQVYWDTNVTAMRHLLELAGDAGTRKIVYCSTQGVHGNVDNPPGDENTPIEPEDYYQYTKYEGEKVAGEFIKQGMDITTLRPTAIYGPGDPARFLMLFKQVKKGYFPFFGKGNALYHPLYIDNFIDAFELAAEKPAGRGNAYLIADNDYYTIKQIVEKIAVVMGVTLKSIHLPFWPMYGLSAVVELLYKPLPMDPPLFRRRVDWYRQNRAFRIDRARKDLGYEAAIGLDEGLRRTFEWYRDNGYL